MASSLSREESQQVERIIGEWKGLTPDARRQRLDQLGASGVSAAVVEELRQFYLPSDAPSASTLPFPTGAIIEGSARWKLLEIANDQGGQGVIYRAQPLDQTGRNHIGKLRLIKVLRVDTKEPRERAIARFRIEMQSLRQCSCRSIIDILDTGESAGTDGQVHPWYAMPDHPDAHSLRQFLSGTHWRRSAPHNLLNLFAELCHGLHEAHRKNVIHGDISAGNVLVEEELPILIDFGAARLRHEDRPDDNPIITHGYAAPEVCAGQPKTARSDIYGVGVLLVEALLGHGPKSFVGQPVEMLAEQIREGLPPAVQRTAEHWQFLLVKILGKALGVVEERYTNALEMAHGLDDLAELWHSSINRMPEGVASSPLPPMTGCFVGRKDFLTSLRERFGQGARIQWVYALGGMGKTTVAAKYGEQHWNDYQAIFWVDADNDTLAGSFERLAKLLQVTGWETMKSPECRAAILSALSNPERWPKPWLLILDNLSSAAQLRPRPEPGSEFASPYLRLPQVGDVLVTSRLIETGWMSLPKEATCELPKFSREDACEFVSRRTGRDLDRLDTAEAKALEELLVEFEGLPLALEHAAAYLAMSGSRLSEYMVSYQRIGLDLMARGVAEGEEDRRVDHTWLVNFRQVEQDSPASAELLRLSAFLNPENIPFELLRQGGADLGESIHAVLTADPVLGIHELLRPLARYSLIRTDRERETWSIHRLVQRAVLHHLGVDEQRRFLKRWVTVLNRLLPGADVANPAAWKPLAAHAIAVSKGAIALEIEGGETAYLLTMAGSWAKMNAWFADAELLFRRALAIYEKSFGPDHLNVVAGLNNLALLLKQTNRHWDAEPLFRRALAITEKSFGPDRPDIAAILNNLAWLLEETNRHWDAEPLFRQALAITEKSFGPDHPNVASVLNNLASLLKRTNRHGDAEPLFRRALAITEKSFGPDHPDVAMGLDNLAGLLSKTNRDGEAEPLVRRALVIYEKSYGPDHPDVATSLNNLALLLQETNRHEEAEPLLRRALAISEKSYGPEHHIVAGVLRNLAGLLRETNRLGDTEALLRRALVLAEKSYGPDHPDVATSHNDLALLLQETNRHEEAEPLLRRALAIWEKSYGPDHPDVARGLKNLAFLLKETNPRGDAEPLFRRALVISEKSYGPDHADVATSLNNLALLLQETNRHEEAEPLLRRALVIWEKSYGPDHPDFARGLTNLAILLKETNSCGDAEPLFRRALAIDEKSYGPDHPKIATGLYNLATLLYETNRHGDAELLFRRALAIIEQSVGPDHPDVAAVLNNLAALLQRTNRHEDAEPLVRRALAIIEQSVGPDHPDVATILNNLALLLQETNRHGEAEPLFRRALAIYEKSIGGDHSTTRNMAQHFAILLEQLKRSKEASAIRCKFGLSR